MATHDLVYATAQEVDDAIRAVKASGANAAAWLTNLAFLNVTAGTATASKAIVLDASKQIDELEVTGNLKGHSLFVTEGYATGRVVLRSIELELTPGAIPNTNVNIVDNTSAGTIGFNGPSITNATDLAAAGSSGSFSMAANGRSITLDLTEAVVGVISTDLTTQDLNSSSATEPYSVRVTIDSGNLVITVRLAGSATTVDWTTILDAGDLCRISIAFVTSS